MSDWDQIDWQALDRLRLGFLEGTAGQEDYWQSESDLAHYDQTYAQRIGWKWDHVLAELKRLGWTPPGVHVTDWGCGSGIAHRAFFDAFPDSQKGGVTLCDRSHYATSYASRKAVRRFPGIAAQVASNPKPGGILILSHVLTELDETQRAQLIRWASEAEAVLWVEPGTYDASRRLIAVREELRSQFSVVAPCTHNETCGMLISKNQPHWCHHFASPPPEIFTDRNWSLFARLTGIDLRSLPVSYLILDRRSLPTPAPGSVRMIGEPRVYKAHALLLGCEASGVSEARLMKRTFPDSFKLAKKEKLPSLQTWVREGEELTGFDASEPESPG